MKNQESTMMKRRTLNALHAVKAYPSYDAYDLESSIVDLLTDLMHLTEKKGMDPFRLVDTSVAHWTVERRGKDTTSCKP